MTNGDERFRAFHEAGHCWGFWAIDRRFRYATLRPRGSEFDAKTVAMREWQFDEVLDLAVVASSGPVAELLYRTDRDADHPDLGEHLAAVLNGGHSDRHKSRGVLGDGARMRRLSLIIEAHWAGVVQVAETLIELRTIQGRHVFEILDATAPETFESPYRALWG